MAKKSKFMTAQELQEFIVFLVSEGEEFFKDEQNFMYVRHEDALLQIQLGGVGPKGPSNVPIFTITAYPDSNPEIKMDEHLTSYLENWNVNHQDIGDVLFSVALEDESKSTVTISAMKLYLKLTPENFLNEMSSLVSDAKSLSSDYLSTIPKKKKLSKKETLELQNFKVGLLNKKELKEWERLGGPDITEWDGINSLLSWLDSDYIEPERKYTKKEIAKAKKELGIYLDSLSRGNSSSGTSYDGF